MSEPDVGQQIRKALTGITNHYDAALIPVGRGPGPKIQNTREAPMPVSADVLDARAMCRSRLASWCLMAIQDRDLHFDIGLSGLDVWGMVSLLDIHSEWFAAHEVADIILDELETSVRELAAVKPARVKGWTSLGTCPLIIEREVDVEGQVEIQPTPCIGTVRAYPNAEPYCDGCLEQNPREWWEREMHGDPRMPRLVTSAQLIKVIHHQIGKAYKPVTIRVWVSRGDVQTHGKDEDGQPLYDRVDVVLHLASKRVA